MSSRKQIDERYDGELKTHGKFSLSIGTSLAIETLFGINDNVPPTNPLPYKSFQYLYINVRTLIRNMHGAVSKELKTVWKTSNYLTEILKELEILPEIIQDYSDNKLAVVFYLDSYKDIKRQYPHATLKQTKGTIALQYEYLEQELYEILSGSSYTSKYNINLVKLNLHTPKKQHSLMLTHNPIDLLSIPDTSHVSLLESHTGVIKPRNRWYTKLHGNNLERIPFGSFSIQVYGDGKHFAGLPYKYKQALTEHAKEHWWNQSFTLKLMKQSLKSMKDKSISSELMKFL